MADENSVQDRADETPAAIDAELAKAPRYTRMSLAEMDILARLHAAGRSHQDMATALGRSTSTIAEALARLRRTPDLTKALLAADDVPALQDWRHARRKAAKRGDHRPAREWLEMAHPELRPPPQNQHSAGGSVTIIIGTPQSPLQLPDIEVSPAPSYGPASGTRAPSVEIQPSSLNAAPDPIAPIGAPDTTQTAPRNTSAVGSPPAPGVASSTGAALDPPSPGAAYDREPTHFRPSSALPTGESPSKR